MNASQLQELQAHLSQAHRLAQHLDSLHARQRLHGSLRPDSMVFLDDGSVRLAEPQTGEAALTLVRLRYVSPEQAGRLPTVDGRSDLYTLGLILYEWLLGRPVFDGNDPLGLGCIAHGLATGHAALKEPRRAAITGEPYDVLMSDWQMPEMDGIGLLTRVAASGPAGFAARFVGHCSAGSLARCAHPAGGG